MTADRIIAATLSRAPSAMRSNSLSKDADSDVDISRSLSFLSPGSSTSSSSSSSDVSVALEEEEDEEAGKESSTTALTPHSALLACENVPLADIGEMVRNMSDDKVTNRATNAYYFVACEIRDTERSYFRDLELLSDVSSVLQATTSLYSSFFFSFAKRSRTRVCCFLSRSPNCLEIWVCLRPFTGIFLRK